VCGVWGCIALCVPGFVPGFVPTAATAVKVPTLFWWEACQLPLG